MYSCWVFVFAGFLGSDECREGSINNFIELLISYRVGEAREQKSWAHRGVSKGEESSQRLLGKTRSAKEVDLRRLGWVVVLEASRKDSEVLSAENVRLASIMTQTSDDLAKVKSEVEEVKAKLQSLQKLLITSQGPMIESSLYKLVRTHAFGDYISACGNVLNPAATTDAIEMISLDFPELDIQKALYGYDEEVRKWAGWLQAEAMLSLPELPLLNHLKSVDHILSADEVLSMDVKEHKMFRELDRADFVCPLGPLMSPHTSCARESFDK